MISRNFQSFLAVAYLGLFGLLVGACSSNTPVAPISPPLSQFQPQIANISDNFQFQVTGATNVSTTVEYLWQNSGSRANINQSCAITAGTAVLTVLDSNQGQRDTNSLSANGTFQSDSGMVGTWKVRVVLTGLSGTLNFRVQKL